MPPLMQQGPPASLQGKSTPLVHSISSTPQCRTERLLEESGMPIAPPMRIRSTTATHLPATATPDLVTGHQRRSDATRALSQPPSHGVSNNDNSNNEDDDDNEESEGKDRDADADGDEDEDTSDNDEKASNDESNNSSSSDDESTCNKNTDDAPGNNEDEGHEHGHSEVDGTNNNEKNTPNAVDVPHRLTNAITPSALALNTLVTVIRVARG